MKNKISQIENYSYSADDIVVLDANIWLYLYPAPSASRFHMASIYSNALKEILSSNVQIKIGSTILSEYLNRYVRIEYDALHRNNFTSFKKFRQSASFNPVSAGASLYASNMMKLCSRYDDDFSTVEIETILNGFECGEVDFNDGLIVSACIKNGWKFITHDGDFVNGGIEVLTCNSRLLACSS